MPADLDVSVAMMVVDEAHYAKNPNALRTQAVSEWAGRSRRALFLTGTPMENKVAEFRVLVGLLRPAVAESLDIADEALDGTRFREHRSGWRLRERQCARTGRRSPKARCPPAPRANCGTRSWPRNAHGSR